MTQEEIAKRNLGESLDKLMNLDPRGYGVCNILYDGARKLTGSPLSINAAEKICSTVKPGDLVYIMVGFVLIPFEDSETDGMVGSLLLARMFVKYGAKPLIICPSNNIKAARAMARKAGIHFFQSVAELKEKTFPAAAVVEFTKKSDEADKCAEDIMAMGMPKAVITIEAPGANKYGHYHNAVGKDITPYEAKMDVLFEKLKDLGVLNISIGDLGNEIGMGSIGEHIKKYVPYSDEGQCDPTCECHGGLLAKSCADNIITATTSDWGADALMAAVAYLKRNKDLMPTAALECDMLETACQNGMIDMYGDYIPSIDGFEEEINSSIIILMRRCVTYSFKLEETCSKWFSEVEKKKYFEENR